MDDEPLSDWAERREQRLSGRFRVVILGSGAQGSHVNPDVPRLISRWNGYEWEPVTVAANLAETKRILHPETAGVDPMAGQTAAPGKPLGSGKGKHRKPQAQHPDRP